MESTETRSEISRPSVHVVVVLCRDGVTGRAAGFGSHYFGIISIDSSFFCFAYSIILKRSIQGGAGNLIFGTGTGCTRFAYGMRTSIPVSVSVSVSVSVGYSTAELLTQ